MKFEWLQCYFIFINNLRGTISQDLLESDPENMSKERPTCKNNDSNINKPQPYHAVLSKNFELQISWNDLLKLPLLIRKVSQKFDYSKIIKMITYLLKW